MADFYLGKVYLGLFNNIECAVMEIDLLNNRSRSNNSLNMRLNLAMQELDFLINNDHPNIIKILGYNISDVKFYIILEPWKGKLVYIKNELVKKNFIY